MKLASLKHGRDGQLVVVDKALQNAVKVPEIAPTLQAALDNWATAAPRLQAVYGDLCAGKAKGAFPFKAEDAHSPLPRAYQWADGSAYLNHVELVRKARGAEMPKEFLTDPLMYQGCSDAFLAPTDPIQMASEDFGIDFESELAVITGDVPMGSSPQQAARHIRLLVLVNDVSLRSLIPAELAKGFGFFVSKPASAFSPVAVTPDELGDAWKDGKAHLPLRTFLNGKLFGQPNCGADMQFSFHELLAHCAKTRNLCAGTILGSGTISNRDRSVGFSCIQEVRMIETIEQGKPVTPFMRFGDRVKIEMLDQKSQSIFGAIDQVVEKYQNP
ncbi:MAG TPA: fumarylacetoacetate hydrolase family protein [Bdellovibrionota bacterium]|jgi:fumarylacetoacetate (FAA) hydrolase